MVCNYTLYPLSRRFYILLPVPPIGDEMPKKGFTQITVSDQLKDQLKSIAEAEGLSMPDLIRRMLGTLYPDYPAKAGKEKIK